MAPATVTKPQTERQNMSTEQRGLMKPGEASIITTPEQYREALDRWASEHVNILTPFQTFSGLAEGYAIRAAMVTVDPNPDHGEVYGKPAPWIKDGHVALAKVGLRKIKQAAAMSTTTFRTDPRDVPNLWECKTEAAWIGLDGTRVTSEATEEWDMRDGSARTRGFTAAQVQEARKHGLRHCETRATNAAIREYGIKQMYSLEEIRKPFVVLRVVYLPDHSDPETRRILTANALAGAGSLYRQNGAGQIAAPQVLEQEDYIDHPPQERPRERTREPEPPKADEPPTPNAVRIMRVDTKPFTYQNGAKKGTQGERWLVLDSTGQEYSTFSKTLADDARAFATEPKPWVEISEQGDQYHSLIDIVKAGTNPTLDGLGKGPL